MAINLRAPDKGDDGRGVVGRAPKVRVRVPAAREDECGRQNAEWKHEEALMRMGQTKFQGMKKRRASMNQSMAGGVGRWLVVHLLGVLRDEPVGCQLRPR